MALGKWDRFKQTFGSYKSARLDDWRGVAEAALSSLQAALKVLRDPPLTNISTVVTAQVIALQKAIANEKKDPAAACKAFAAVETICKAQLKVAQAALMAEPPNRGALAAAMAEPGGKAFIDALVAAVGDRASTDEQKTLVTNAIRVRYDVKTLSGELSTKSLPRLYKMLGVLPDDHTTDNAKLRVIKRSKNAGEDTKGKTVYSASYGKGTVTLEGGESGYRAKKVKIKTDKGTTTVKFFDAAVLHEVGHAVDDRDDVMDNVPDNPAFGKWREESVDSVIAAAGTHLGFNKTFAAAGKPQLKSILEGAFAGGNALKPKDLAGAISGLHTLGLDGIARDPGIAAAAKQRVDKKDKVWGTLDHNKFFEQVELDGKDQIEKLVRQVIDDICTNDVQISALDAVTAVFKPFLDTQDQVDWSALAAHPALSWLSAIGAQTVGNYKLSESKLQGLALKTDDGTRVYQQSYSNQFWSYQIEARQHMVRPYQFRARGEWFAEAYTAYFLGLMGTGHVAYRWLNGLYGDPKLAS